MTDKKTRPPRGSDRIPSLEEMGVKPEECGIGHPHIDDRILDACRLIVQRIDDDPERFHIALENLEGQRARQGRLSRASEEWRAILDRPWVEIRALLLEGSDEGQRLRSSHPFRGLVSADEHYAITARHPPPWSPPGWKPPPPPSPELMARLLADKP